jgi:hypothetical protein
MGFNNMDTPPHINNYEIEKNNTDNTREAIIMSPWGIFWP